MDLQGQRIMAKVMEHGFQEDLRALLDKHNIHAGFFTWVLDAPEHKDPSSPNGVGAAAIVRSGCLACSTMALAVAALALDADERELFIDAIHNMPLTARIDRTSIADSDLSKAN